MKNAIPRYKEIRTRHAGRCTRCTNDIEENALVLWDSQARLLYCQRCGQDVLNAGSLFAGLTDAPPPPSAE